MLQSILNLQLLLLNGRKLRFRFRTVSSEFARRQRPAFLSSLYILYLVWFNSPGGDTVLVRRPSSHNYFRVVYNMLQIPTIRCIWLPSVNGVLYAVRICDSPASVLRRSEEIGRVGGEEPRSESVVSRT